MPRIRAVFVVIGFCLAGVPSARAPAGSWNSLADDFVDRLFCFRQGYPPIAIARRAPLGEGSPTL